MTPDTEELLDPESVSVTELTSELQRRGERLAGGFDPSPDDLCGEPLAMVFITAAARACDLYRITLALWEQDSAQRPESSRPWFLGNLRSSDQLIGLASRRELLTPDRYAYGERVWERFLQTTADTARLLAELEVTHEPAPAPGPEAGSRLLGPGWEAITAPLLSLPAATAPADRSTLERIALTLARSYEAWMEHLGFMFTATPEGEVDFIAVDPARWTATPLPEPSDVPPAADVPLDWFADARQLAEALAQRDGRFDPRFIDRSVRRMLRAWLAAGDGDTSLLSTLTSESIVADAVNSAAEEFGRLLPLRDVRWRGISVITVYPNGSFPSNAPELRTVIRAEAAEDRPLPVISGAVSGPLRFVIECTLKPDDDDRGAWRLCTARVVTEEGRNQTPYVVRRETGDEYRERMGLRPEAEATPTPRSEPPYQYAISCHYFDDSLRTGGSVTLQVTRDTVPTRAEVAFLLTPLAFEDLCRKARTDYGEPLLDGFETRELLKAPDAPSPREPDPTDYGSPMTPTESEADDRASLTEGLGRALRQPWKLTQAASLATDAFAERYAASHGLDYQPRSDTPRHTWLLANLYAPRSHSFMRGSLADGPDGLLFYASRRVGGGRNAGWWNYTVAFYELPTSAAVSGGVACVPRSGPSLGGLLKTGSALPAGLTGVPIDNGPFDAHHEVGTAGSASPASVQALFSDDFVAWMQTLPAGGWDSTCFEINQGGLCIYTHQTLDSTEQLDTLAASATRILTQVQRTTAEPL